MMNLNHRFLGDPAGDTPFQYFYRIPVAALGAGGPITLRLGYVSVRDVVKRKPARSLPLARSSLL